MIRKSNYPSQRTALIRLAGKYEPNVILIEDAANGSPLIADLRNLNHPGIPTPISIKPKGSKVERLSVQSSRIEAGDVRLPSSSSWLDEFKAEILAFPNGRHDDQVDALSHLMAWVERKTRNLRQMIGAAPELIEMEDFDDNYMNDFNWP